MIDGGHLRYNNTARFVFIKNITRARKPKEIPGKHVVKVKQTNLCDFFEFVAC